MKLLAAAVLVGTTSIALAQVGEIVWDEAEKSLAEERAAQAAAQQPVQSQAVTPTKEETLDFIRDALNSATASVPLILNEGETNRNGTKMIMNRKRAGRGSTITSFDLNDIRKSEMNDSHIYLYCNLKHCVEHMTIYEDLRGNFRDSRLENTDFIALSIINSDMRPRLFKALEHFHMNFSTVKRTPF